MDADVELDIAQPLRHRRAEDDPLGEPTGALFYGERAEAYLAAARAAFNEPTTANYKAAEAAAFHLSNCYSGWDGVSPGGSPREAQAAWALLRQASVYRALAASSS